MGTRPVFAGGVNIAMKVPPHQFAATVQFYAETLRLEQMESGSPDSVVFLFGTNRLWIDQVATVSQAEIYLEIVTDDLAAADQHLKAADVTRCDAIEPLPPDLPAFWIANPAAIVHLVVGGSNPVP